MPSKFIPFCLVFIITMVITAQAYAVKIIPPRLVLGPDVKLEYMFVKNNSDKREVYRFKWKHIAMDKQGNILNLDKVGMDKAPPGYKPLEKIVRFSPRRAILEPGQTQRVTFLISRPQDATAGEYRSHFMVEREPDPNQQVQDQEDPSASAPRVSIDVSVSRAVPIYVLHGQTDAKLQVVGAEIKKNTAKKEANQPNHIANFRVQKTGNRSVIGVARVFCTSGGEEVVISKVSKVFAVYAEGEFRDEKVAVAIPPKGCSAYRLAIQGHPDDVMSGQVLANATFQ